MKTVRCISRSVSGMTEVALPTLFVSPFQDGEERPLPDEIADKLLGKAPNTTANPNFEEVVEPAPAPKTKPTAQTDSATVSTSADGGQA